ncbi:cupredoxin domain-containing protein [Sphingobium subterraneum]|uniref:Plastocyanin n=1 Tax=Sphingobium subterraneum TaxID=627688 RepID=A0A841J5H8_9SPHN|nr:cupredoxin domain-containing protein [Sphingobium subterraneum]MBB6123798.1 plastocyanin [Sphingobium subterraneum]
MTRTGRLGLGIAIFAMIVPGVLGATGPERRVDITLSNFRFAPDHVQLKAGEKVDLHFVNAGSGGHNFAAPEFFAAAQIDAPGKLKDGKVELRKGESTDVVLTPVRGDYPVRCTHFLHSGLGMKGDIAVR